MTLGRIERLQIMLTEEELGAIDDWRFGRRMPSRAAAIRELLKRGLAAEGFVLADKNVKSKEFGLLAKQKKSVRRSEGGPPSTNARHGND
ncbi:MAG: hypothetical protein WA858_10825 [Xanthobacteraceae bacterium]